jgi:hypothetical protein
MSGIFHFTGAWPQMVLRKDIKCAILSTRLLWWPWDIAQRPGSHFMAPKKLIAFWLCKDLNPALHHDKRDHGIQQIRQWYIEELCLCLMVWGSRARPVMTYSCLCKGTACKYSNSVPVYPWASGWSESSAAAQSAWGYQCVTQTYCSAGLPGPAAES